jgi:hypothetical protein
MQPSIPLTGLPLEALLAEAEADADADADAVAVAGQLAASATK